MTVVIYSKFVQALADELGRDLVRNTLNPWILASATWGDVDEEPASCGKTFETVDGLKGSCRKKEGHKGKHRDHWGLKSQLRADKEPKPIEGKSFTYTLIDDAYTTGYDAADVTWTTAGQGDTWGPFVTWTTGGQGDVWKPVATWDLRGFVNGHSTWEPIRHLTPSQAQCLTDLGRPAAEATCPDSPPTCGKTMGSLRCDREAGHSWSHRDSQYQVHF